MCRRVVCPQLFFDEKKQEKKKLIVIRRVDPTRSG